MNRLVLDIDGILANFVEGFLAYAEELGGYEGMPCCWKSVDEYQFFPDHLFKGIARDAAFWMGLRPMPKARVKMITNGLFPDLYLTARPIDSAITAHWLANNLFPVAKVITVDRAEDKLRYLEPGDVFVDDFPATVREAQDKGVMALLMDAPFHRGETAASLEGLARITCLSQVASLI